MGNDNSFATVCKYVVLKDVTETYIPFVKIVIPIKIVLFTVPGLKRRFYLIEVVFFLHKLTSFFSESIIISYI